MSNLNDNSSRQVRKASLPPSRVTTSPCDVTLSSREVALLAEQLREPINAIRNAAYVLERIPLPANSERSVTTISTQSRMILRLLEKISAG